ncbi:thioredoxin-disulfide reductase [Blautia wexlerae]|uniref:thioredoxin-disulfide reductase n=1 Tax=Blautia wexlerae TaxID=418240 RepID=UPI00156F825B|nr:thioredoxin-disulfide reductase [Blautia wexlerae]NSE03374.1 thioredoxin-disulfide reductase [Blautia wexlerae]NSF76952.1 thioredoxin-disulfide reductase [Blautia wexlerae]
MSEIYDTAILGAGPAGISAAIYAARAKLNTLWLDKQFEQGGQVLNTYEVDNYPGMPGISGMDLGEAMAGHAAKLGIEPLRENVLSVEDAGTDKIIRTKTHEYRARTVILACGASHRKLNIPGEEELSGMGVSYCATCDGAFFKNKTAVVVGGGNMAVEDAIFLSRICKKVYLVHRREELRAERILQESLFACENVEIRWNSVAVEIQGTECVTGLKIRDVQDATESVIATDGAFIAVGILPNTDKFRNLVKLDEAGYIVAGEEGITETPGIFAAGDIRTKMLRQVVTAVADGANAVASVQNYLIHRRD